MAQTTDLPAEDGRTLRLVQAEAGDKPEALAAALAIPAIGAVVVLADGADSAGAAGGDGDADADAVLLPRLVQLVGRGLVRAAREASALCIARGGANGLVSLLGRAVADTDRAPPLLGVAPASQVALPGTPRDGDASRQALTPGLTHLVLTAGADWGSELRAKIDLAQVLADGKPVMMVVIGGGAGTAAEVLQAVRRGWPVLVVKGSGGAADALARQWRLRQADADDPVLAEIVADGNLTCITLGANVGEAVETMARQVLRQSGGESVLRQAWRRFAALDRAAIVQQVDFKNTQKRILVLGVLAVFLAIVYSLLTDEFVSAHAGFDLLRSALNGVLILVPIASSVLIAASNRFKPGKRWVLLRSAAESIKREMFLYRLRAEGYDADDTREKNLSKAVEDITRRLARTEANTTALPAYTGPIPPANAASALDDGLRFLSTDQYVRMRLEDQLSFYRRKSVLMETQFRQWQMAALLAGAAGTLLAALSGSAVIWIALSAAIGAACITYLSFQQTETNLVSYNQTATDLDNILSWWTALEPEEQALPEHIKSLAEHTEKVLADELNGWAQNMTDALEKLRGAQSPKDGAGATAPPPAPPPLPPLPPPLPPPDPDVKLLEAPAPVPPEPAPPEPAAPEPSPDGADKKPD